MWVDTPLKKFYCFLYLSLHRTVHYVCLPLGNFKMLIFQAVDYFSKVSWPEHWDWPCHWLRKCLSWLLLRTACQGSTWRDLWCSPTRNVLSALHVQNCRVLSSATGTDTKSLCLRRGPVYNGWKSGHCLSWLLICLNFSFHEYSCPRFWNLLFGNNFCM